MVIREINIDDRDGLLELYTHLHEDGIPAVDEKLDALWKRIVADEDYHIIVAEADGKIVSSCTCVIIPNLTRKQSPYAFVENVVTHSDYRKQGLASACLERAKQIAAEEGCYKMMLLTGSKEESTLRFYEAAGYNRKDKTAFIQWI
jgi:GNAT superfamily N-acetyltransferase